MKEYDAIVIGAGPGGYACAIRLAQLGLKAACIEKEYFGGTCLNVGCIPSKALIYAATQFHNAQHGFADMGITVKDVKCDLGKMQDWKGGVVKKLTQGVEGLIKRNGADSYVGMATFKDKNTLEVKTSSGTETLKSKNIVIATGSTVAQIPFLPFNGKNIISSTEALELRELPKHLVVIGGGFIGVEIGVVYAKLGAKVTIVEAMHDILPSIDSDLVAVAKKKMKKFGIEILTNTKAKALKEDKPESQSTLHLDVETEKGVQTLEASHILVSVGRKPNTEGLGLDKVGVKMDKQGNIPTDSQSRTNVQGVYAIGDVAGPPQLAHRATMDGLLVAASINGEKSFKDYKTVPWAVFCDPEIAVCGLSEKEAKEKGHKFTVGKFPFAASGRALSTNETDGFIKVLIEEGSQILLGVHIVGPEASNLIAEAALAVEMGACAEDVVRTIHTHPTLPEAFPEAVEAALGHAIHIYKPPRR